jgi:hypothetical protein
MCTKIRIDYRQYPEFMFAMLAAFLPSNEGDDLRRVSGDVVFRSVDKDGNTFKNGLLHSFDDLPATNTGEYRVWYKDGLRHREGDLPAIISKDFQGWYINGGFHREGDLPAVISTDYMAWYKNGRLYRDHSLPPIVDRKKFN